VAAEADQQLSLAAALGLPEESPTPSGTDPAPEPEALASGPARPRTRQRAPATAAEHSRLLALLRELQDPARATATDPAATPFEAWTTIARVLLNLDETITRS
jgi:hypothetical protein